MVGRARPGALREPEPTTARRSESRRLHGRRSGGRDAGDCGGLIRSTASVLELTGVSSDARTHRAKTPATRHATRVHPPSCVPTGLGSHVEGGHQTPASTDHGPRLSACEAVDRDLASIAYTRATASGPAADGSRRRCSGTVRRPRTASWQRCAVAWRPLRSCVVRTQPLNARPISLQQVHHPLRG